MALTINGLGTALYGRHNWRRDGSFQATKWFVVAFFPVAPLKTLRVRPYASRTLREDLGQLRPSREYGYEVLEELPLSHSQVLRTYAFAIAFCAWSVLLVWFFMGKLSMLDHETFITLSMIAAFVMLLCMPFIVLSWYRQRAFISEGGAGA